MGGIKLSILEKIANLRSSSSGIYSDRVDGVMCIQRETCFTHIDLSEAIKHLQ